ncbi:MAG: hypothetical protein AAB431_02510 [Patescibacteria group bacterium]
MTRLLDDVFSKGLETIRALVSHAGFTTELGEAIRKKGGVDRAINALTREFFPPEVAAPPADPQKNPFERPAAELVTELRRANAEEKWGLTEDVFVRLLSTAPAWPVGRDSYLSFRIRFGEGDAGVEKTFEAHAARFKRVHAKNWRWEYLLSGKKPFNKKDVERLRLLAGNDTHKPTVEWVIVDLETNRTRSDITSVRGPSSIADEGIVIGWLFPKRVEAIDYKDWCAWFCAGYELNVPEFGDESWQRVPCVNRDLDSGEAELSARWRSDDGSRYSVPVLRECQR